MQAALEASQTVDVDADAIPLASRRRRALAFITDLSVFFALSSTASSLIALIVPQDDLYSMLPSAVAGGLLGCAYLGFSYVVFGNTLGKWLFGLAVMSSDAQPISMTRRSLRLVAQGLLPINALLVLVSRARRDVPDLLAHTEVVLDRPARNAWLGLTGAVAVTVISMQLSGFAMRVGMLNAPVWQAAKRHLREVEPAIAPALLPVGFDVSSDSAAIDARLGDHYRRVLLKREAHGWQVQDSALVSEPHTDKRVSFSVAH
jgi:uncharacterized RDD family membrane protein YckC